MNHDGGGTIDRCKWFTYDGDHIALVFSDADGEASGDSSLTNGYLHGPAIDQILAEAAAHRDRRWLQGMAHSRESIT